MYIRELKLWNFRKYGSDSWDLDSPHLRVVFSNGVNVLIGENDSGKTAILDSIKFILKTHAYEWIKLEDEDFYLGSNKLRIELIFSGITDHEAKNFVEWIGWEKSGIENIPILRLIYQAERKGKKIIPSDLHAGMDEIGFPVNAEAKEFLKATYLKALRDTENELIAKKNSRLSQILQGHSLFKIRDDVNHDFTEWFRELNERIKDWFENDEQIHGKKSRKQEIKGVIDGFLHEFIGEKINSKLYVSDPEIKAVLEKLSLVILGSVNSGLGTLNRLYMAAELLHLKKEWDGVKLCLIEELEAHLHPQAQMKIIEVLLKESDVQFILTTHSPNLASKVPIENLIICNGSGVYSLAKGLTKLEDRNYKYLRRFLDVTKSNLFFAKGVIIVEGWAEEILVPAIASKMGLSLTRHEVSVVNVGSTAYLHFAKIFLRQPSEKIGIPISVVADLDIRPDQYGLFDSNKQNIRRSKIETSLGDLEGSDIAIFIAKEWTLEWCLFRSHILGEFFRRATSKVHSKTESFRRGPSGWNVNFEKALITKLTKAEGNLDKVAVAGELSELISSEEVDFGKEDDYLEYLTKAIKYACGIKN